MKYFKHEYKDLEIYVPIESISDEKAMENKDLYGSPWGVNQIGISDGDNKTISTTNELVDGDNLQAVLVERKDTGK